MIVKLLGAVLVVAGSFLAGTAKIRNCRERVKELKALQYCMTLLQGEIHYALSTVADSISHVSQRCANLAVQDFLKEIADRLNEDTGQTLQDIWEESCNDKFTQMHLEQEDFELLLMPGNFLGYLDTEVQSKAIEQYIMQLAERIDTLQKGLANKSKLIRAVSIGIGMLICILLI